MTTFKDIEREFIEKQERKLAFKMAALRYCYHSKKQDALMRDIKHIQSVLAYMRGEGDEL